MPRWQRVYLAACAFVIGYALAYALAQWSRWPRLTYFPLERGWALSSGPASPLPMGYVGLVLWGLGGGVVLAAVAWIAGARLPRLGDRALRLIAAWTLSAFLVAGAFFTWNLWPF